MTIYPSTNVGLSLEDFAECWCIGGLGSSRSSLHHIISVIDECGLSLEDVAERWRSGGLGRSRSLLLYVLLDECALSLGDLFFLMESTIAGYHWKTLRNVGALVALVAAAH